MTANSNSNDGASESGFTLKSPLWVSNPVTYSVLPYCTSPQLHCIIKRFVNCTLFLCSYSVNLQRGICTTFKTLQFFWTFVQKKEKSGGVTWSVSRNLFGWMLNVCGRDRLLRLGNPDVCDWFFFAAEFLLLDFFQTLIYFFSLICVYMSNFSILKFSQHRGKKKIQIYDVFFQI